MNKPKLEKIYYKTYVFTNEVKDNHLDVYSAGTAFYLFISIIPFFIALFSLVPYTPMSRQDVLGLSAMLPNEFDILVQAMTAETYVKNSARLWIALIIAIWSAARGIMYMTKGLNEIYDVTERRNYFILRFWAAIYTLFIIVAIVVLLVMGVFGKRIIEFVSAHLPHLPGNAAAGIAAIINFRVLITILCLFVLFVFLYTLLPNTRLLWLYQTPGAALCSFAWWMFTKLFSFVVGKFGGFSMYGSMATAIASMLWLYCCMYILFMCAELNNHFARSIINHIKNRRKSRSNNDNKIDKDAVET
ncbi:MAG: YihY/virulence factor BrkB family protein [Lachnospiraceae bacterium]|nr:YihY/virulence factor BrkB family protein [Lachnospiraceae bacterium]